MIRVGINGFGRIGRIAFRSISKRKDITVVAINDLLEVDYLAYMLKYDSVHGRFDGDISVEDNFLIVDGNKIRVSAQKNPATIAWDAVDVDYVIESTGFFTTKDTATLHIKGGAKKVVISAPSKDAPMYVMGVNNHELTKETTVFSNASCTTNCLAPIVKVLHENFTIEQAMMTTVHSATSTQRTVDGPSPKKWRRGRAAIHNIIPTTTGAAKAVTKVYPELEGKITGMAVRVPTCDVSLIDVTVRFAKDTSYEAIKKAMKHAAANELKGILGYTEDAVVSQDFVSEPRTAVFDASAGLALNDTFFKIIAWYDNEFGYASKLVDLIIYNAKL